jgi:hypothetical protein
MQPSQLHPLAHHMPGTQPQRFLLKLNAHTRNPADFAVNSNERGTALAAHKCLVVSARTIEMEEHACIREATAIEWMRRELLPGHRCR